VNLRKDHCTHDAVNRRTVKVPHLPPSSRGRALRRDCERHARRQSDGTVVLASGSASERSRHAVPRECPAQPLALSQYCFKGLLRWATRECPPPPIKISVPRSGDVALGNAEGGPLTHR
jgi:hypothetical protein